MKFIINQGGGGGGQPLLFKNKIWDFLGRRNPLSKMSFTN